jgi:hypothetical protein
MQPGNIAWAIYDSDYREQAATMPNNGAFATPLFYPELEADMEKVFEKKRGFKGNTAEALAQAMGISAKALAATVARYNDLVAKGVDEDFGKRQENLRPIQKGPFYAMKIPAPIVITFGGLNVNPQMGGSRQEGRRDSRPVRPQLCPDAVSFMLARHNHNAQKELVSNYQKYYSYISNIVTK